MTRRLVVAVLAALVAAAGTTAVAAGSEVPGRVTAAAAASADETTAYQIDAGHGGGLAGGTQRPPLAKRWSRDLGGTVHYPLAAMGKVFALAPTPHRYEGTTLYAIDAATGRDAWGPIDLGRLAEFAYGDGVVFVVSRDGVVQAFDAATGAQRWIIRMQTMQSRYAPPPVYRNGILYLMGEGSGAQIFALAAGTGQVLWTGYTNAAGASPAVSDTLAFSSDPCVPVVAWNAKTGGVVWSSSRGCSGGSNPATAVLGAGLLWIRGAYNRLPTAFDPATGEPVVTFSAQAPPAFDATRGYFLFNGVLEGRDPRSQLPLWSFSGDGRLSAAPIVVNGFVYASSASGQIWAIDGATGVVAWTDNVGAPVLRSGEGTWPEEPRVGLAAGQGLVLVPATNLLVAYGSAAEAPAPVAAASPSPLGTAATPSPSFGGDESWSFRLDPTNGGVLASGVERPPYRRRWARDLGGVVPYALAADGKVFATGGMGLYALDAATGDVAWGPESLGPGVVLSNLAYGDGRVFAAAYAGPLQAFDAATGDRLWSREFTEYGSEGFEAAPVYHRGMLYVLSTKSILHVFAPSTGREVWRTYAITSRFGGGPAVTDDLVFAGVAADPATGERFWSGVGSSEAPPVLGHDRVWASQLVQDADTGELVGAYSGGPPALDGQRAYVLDGWAVKARDPRTQFNQWTFVGDGHLVTDPIVVNGHVYVGSSSGSVWALDPATGVPVWTGEAGPITKGTRLSAGQGLLLVPAGNSLVAMEPVTAPPPAPAEASLAWGWNPVDQLGDGTTVDRRAPVTVRGLTDVTQLAAGPYHSVAVRADGTVWAWGWNGVGSVGDGTTVDRARPVQVPRLHDVIAVAAGFLHNLAVTRDGAVWAWGWNGVGQLGDGTTVDRHRPVPVGGLSGVTAVAAGGHHSLAVRSDGAVAAWGWNILGQLGDGSTADRHTPVRVPGLDGVKEVAAGLLHSLARKADGTVRAWGWNGAGQLGDGTTADHRTPAPVTGLANVVQIAASVHHNLVVTDDGRVSAWGWNALGQLGDGTVVDRRTPVVVPGLRGVTEVAAGCLHSLARGDHGEVYTWGWNGVGQLGDGTTTDHRTPARVGALAGVQAVGAGYHHSLAA